MILHRYFTREILLALTAVTAALLIIFLSNQIIHYLNDAASGKLAPAILLDLIGLQIPYLLGLLLPIGLFFGVLFALGRLYADHEMVIFFGSGLSYRHLLAMVMRIAFFVAVLIAVLTLWINPIIAKHKDNMTNMASEKAFIASVLPGRFQMSPDGNRVFYIQNISGTDSHVENVFMAERPSDTHANAHSWTVISAAHAIEKTVTKTGADFLVAQNGYRYQGTPGEKNYLVIQFDDYGVRLNPIIQAVPEKDEQADSTWQLWQKRYTSLDAIAELQWRFSIPLVALVLAFLAVPLSRVKPRQGKYAQLLPAVLICIIYVNLLFVARTWIYHGAISPWLGLWWVHGVVLLFSLIFLSWQSWRPA